KGSTITGRQNRLPETDLRTKKTTRHGIVVPNWGEMDFYRPDKKLKLRTLPNRHSNN
ncbi:10427_t:CDS:1, partial [Gigaspora rosea]